MSQKAIHTESIQYLYDNPPWLYDYVFAFFYGFVLNDNYGYNAKSPNSANILPLTSYTYDSFRQHSAQAFGNIDYDYDYFCGNMTISGKKEYGSNHSWESHGVAQSHTMTKLETGFDYFGARYYDSDLSVWLSVDPLASKYPGITPYNYCFNNPIMFRDLWGLEGEPTIAKIRKVKSDREGQNKFRFRNKTTGENGYIYTPEGMETKEVKENMNNKKYNNFEIYTYDKKRNLINEEKYDSNGDIALKKGGDLAVFEIIEQGYPKAYYEHKNDGDWYLDHEHFTQYKYHESDNTKYWILLSLSLIDRGTITSPYSAKEMINDENFENAYMEAIKKYEQNGEANGIFIKISITPMMYTAISTYYFFSAKTGELLSKGYTYH